MKYQVRLSLLLLFLITTISSAFAQQKLTFRVADFSYDAFDQTARDERFRRYDGSGFLYAIVKVSGDSPADKLGEYRFNFGNMNHIVEDHDGELNTTIEGGKTYTMMLSAQAAKVYTQMVMFSITPADSKAVVMITKEESGQNEEMFGTIDETGGVANALEFGTYTYKVTAMNYHSSEGRFTLNSQADTHEEKVTLRRNGSNITFSVASEADIYINGIKRGTRSWTGLMKAGNYTIECRQTNHRPSQQTISVEEDRDRTIQLAPPTPITGILSITSNPLAANIKIDGKDYGTTPKNITDMLIGHHTIVISKDGYTPKTEQFDISEDETQRLNIALEKSAVPQAATAVSKAGTADGDKTFTVKGVTFTMKPVAGDTFTMGATSEQGSDAWFDEKPTHQVTLSSYYIGETEVTQALWQAVMGSNPSDHKGSNLPVEQVSWYDCQEFITKLNAMTGQKFRLPTEAEWEFAARGGNKSKGYKYSGSNNIDNVAWYDGNSGYKTHAVKTKSPNELGIYDMSGNVKEWCSDWEDSYSSNAQTNPTGPSTGSIRVYRGGKWDHRAGDCRVSKRGYSVPEVIAFDLGFRLAL